MEVMREFMGAEGGALLRSVDVADREHKVLLQ